MTVALIILSVVLYAACVLIAMVTAQQSERDNTTEARGWLLITTFFLVVSWLTAFLAGAT